jgi:group I intron endonuclease
MFYYLYQITNLVNNKIYVGIHKTKNLNDGYMGSGKVIKSAIEKYGIGNFKKDILETFEDDEAMYAREKEFVNAEFLLREDVYNLRRGGFGGFDYINESGIPKMLGKNHSNETKDRLSEKMIERYKNGTAPQMTEEIRTSISKAKKGTKYKSRPPKSADHKEKLREANIGKKHSLIACPQCGKLGGERAIKRWHKVCAGVTQW